MVKCQKYSKVRRSVGTKVPGRLWLSDAVAAEKDRRTNSLRSILNRLAAQLGVPTDKLVGGCQKEALLSRDHFEEEIARLAKVGAKLGLGNEYDLVGGVKEAVRSYSHSYSYN